MDAVYFERAMSTSDLRSASQTTQYMSPSNVDISWKSLVNKGGSSMIDLDAMSIIAYSRPTVKSMFKWRLLNIKIMRI